MYVSLAGKLRAQHWEKKNGDAAPASYSFGLRAA